MFTGIICLSGFQSSPGALNSTSVRQYLVNFLGLAGTGNTTVDKTELIFSGLGHGKLS